MEGGAGRESSGVRGAALSVRMSVTENLPPPGPAGSAREIARDPLDEKI
jgi:hypothetical protein